MTNVLWVFEFKFCEENFLSLRDINIFESHLSSSFFAPLFPFNFTWEGDVQKTREPQILRWASSIVPDIFYGQPGFLGKILKHILECYSSCGSFLDMRIVFSEKWKWTENFWPKMINPQISVLLKAIQTFPRKWNVSRIPFYCPGTSFHLWKHFT